MTQRLRRGATSRVDIKRNAQRAVRQRIWKGNLKRQPCEVCGTPDAHAHHEDYSRRFDVKWLCPKHHAEVHKNV